MIFHETEHDCDFFTNFLLLPVYYLKQVACALNLSHLCASFL